MKQIIKFKVGDKLRCKPGFNKNHNNWRDSTSGGAGYREGKIITVQSIYGASEDPIVWPTEGEGIFQQALELVNQFNNSEEFNPNEPWHVVVTPENMKELCMWRFGNLEHMDYLKRFPSIVGQTKNDIDSSRLKYKSHNPINNTTLFGIEITTEQFRKHILGMNINQYENYEIY